MSTRDNQEQLSITTNQTQKAIPRIPCNIP